MSGKWSDPLLADAWRAAFAGPQGPMLVASLERVMREIPPAEPSALQANHGRRSFAAELIALANGVTAANVPPPVAKTETPGRLPGRRIGREQA